MLYSLATPCVVCPVSSPVSECVCVCVCVCGGRAKVSGVLMHRGRGVEETGPRETTAVRQWCGV